MAKRHIPVLCAVALIGCSHPEPGVRIETVEVVREVQKPCPAERPERPKPLGNLPVDAVALAATLAAKLAEYSGEGKYADRAETFFDTCEQ